MNDVSGFAAALAERANSRCELCGSKQALSVLEVPPSHVADKDRCALICSKCAGQIANSEPGDLNHWRCLNDSAWSEVVAVKVLTWRLLKRIETQTWAKDLLDQMYLEDDVQKWAESVSPDDEQSQDDEGGNPTVDSFGAALLSGDSVCIVKDLNVKGTTFTAKRGTIVRNIRLTNNPEHVEGRVNGTVIVLKTCFLKKAT